MWFKFSAVLSIFLFFSSSYGGNLDQLVFLAQNSTYKNLKFIKAPNFAEQNKRLNFSFDGRYAVSPKANSGYKTRDKSLSAKLEYVLFDGGESDARQRMTAYLTSLPFYQNDENLNLTAFEIGKIYFSAVALDESIGLKEAVVNEFKNVIKEAGFWAEFGEIGQDEYSALNSVSARFLDELEELKFSRFELSTRINLLSDADIDFEAGSRIKMPDFALDFSTGLDAKFQDYLAKHYGNRQAQSGLMPKIYFKNTQKLDSNIFKIDENIVAKNGVGAFGGYLASSRPMFEIAWKFPSSSKERELKMIEERQSVEILNSEQNLSEQRLQNLKQQIASLAAKIRVSHSVQNSWQDELKRAVQRYENGDINGEELLFIIDEICAKRQKFIDESRELEVAKMQWYLERGERIAAKIL